MAKRIKSVFISALFLTALGAVGCTAPDQQPIDSPVDVSAAKKPNLDDRINAIKAAPPKPVITSAVIPPKLTAIRPSVNTPSPTHKFESRPASKNGKDVKGAKENAPIDLSKSRVTVKIFTTSWSPLCQDLESFLASSHIKYIRYDVDLDYHAKQYAYTLTGNYSVPLAVVGNVVIPGYDVAAVKKAVRAFVVPTSTSMKGYEF